MEEEKETNLAAKKRGRKQDKPTKGIYDPRSESRQQFTKILMADPRQRLIEIPINAAKERRQKIFNENREKRTKEEIIPNNTDNKQLVEMMKNLTKALREYENATNKELENIMRVIELRDKETRRELDKLEEPRISIEARLKQANKLVKENKKNNGNPDNQKVQVKWKIIKDTYIHNWRKFKNGVAVLKQNNSYIKVPLIPKYKFNHYTRKWNWVYMIQTMTESIRYVEFYKKNHE